MNVQPNLDAGAGPGAAAAAAASAAPQQMDIAQPNHPQGHVQRRPRPDLEPDAASPRQPPQNRVRLAAAEVSYIELYCQLRDRCGAMGTVSVLKQTKVFNVDVCRPRIHMAFIQMPVNGTLGCIFKAAS